MIGTRGRQLKKIGLRTIDFTPKVTDLPSNFYLFDINLELHSGLKVGGCEIKFIIQKLLKSKNYCGSVTKFEGFFYLCNFSVIKFISQPLTLRPDWGQTKKCLVLRSVTLEGSQTKNFSQLVISLIGTNQGLLKLPWRYISAAMCLLNFAVVGMINQNVETFRHPPVSIKNPTVKNLPLCSSTRRLHTFGAVKAQVRFATKYSDSDITPQGTEASVPERSGSLLWKKKKKDI